MLKKKKKPILESCPLDVLYFYLYFPNMEISFETLISAKDCKFYCIGFIK